MSKKTKPAEEEVPTIEEVAEEMATVLFNSSPAQSPIQLRRQEVFEKYRKLNPTWEPKRYEE